MINELVIVTGASGAGKTAISKNVIDQYPERYAKFITTTTRDLRETEKEGVDYYHVPLDVFKQQLLENEFFEAEVKAMVDELELDVQK
jgi:guanylate kinase